MSAATNLHRWWKEAVVYQVWPASFCDANGDGWGDIKGIISKLDHIKELGTDVVWVSPIYKSPQVDMGYDIADYRDIDPKYGTMNDVDELIRELKKRDMKLMMDLVVNHTSDKHAWFEESRKSKTSPKRDWYIWKPAKTDGAGNRVPPNNWAMILGEGDSAWAWDEGSQEYYLALFTPEQPDLNWENPAVRAEVHNIMRFWLDKGCCGFRMDVINHISKHQDFPDAPVVVPDHKYQPGHKWFANGPRLHEYLRAIHDEVLSKYDAMTVGEMPFVHDEKEILRVVGEKAGELNMIFIFALVGIDDEQYRMSLGSWGTPELRGIVSKWQSFMIENGGWNSVFWENHDNPRGVSRYTSDEEQYREVGAKLLALMHTTLSGTPYVYQGQEIGMKNFPLSWDISEYKDVEAQNYWSKMQKMHNGDEGKMAFAKKVLQAKARDHARTPVQWNSGPNAGFCKEGSTPWMRVVEDYREWNAEKQVANKEGLSVFQFWKRGLANRKMHKEVFVYGGFEVVDGENSDIFAYKRSSKSDGNWLVVLNFTKKEVSWAVPNEVNVKAWVAGNYVSGKPEQATSGTITLKPFEGLLAMLG